jgi:hypothetical protein
MKGCLVLVILAIPLLEQQAMSQEGSTTEPSQAPREITITNPFQNDVNFDLSCGDSDWTTFTIAGQNVGRYNCSEDVPLNFTIRTGNIVRNYVLPYQLRYQLTWKQLNQSVGYYDLEKIQ